MSRYWIERDLQTCRLARTGGIPDTNVHPAADHAVALAYAETGRRILAQARRIDGVLPPPRWPEKLCGLGQYDLPGTFRPGSPGYVREMRWAKVKRILRRAARRIFATSLRITLHRSPSPEARGVTLASLALLLAREVAAGHGPKLGEE